MGMDALYELKALWDGLQKVLDNDDLQANLDSVSVMCDSQASLNHVIGKCDLKLSPVTKRDTDGRHFLEDVGLP